MVMHHPSRRFELVAVDVLEMTPVTPRGNRKVLVIGDMFTRFIMALAMPDEKAETVSRLPFDRWVTVFGPPEQLLSDQGRNFVGGVIEHLCKKVGTRKIFTSAYHPQTNGFIERYNRTLCTELRRHLITDEDWDVTLALAQFRYNSTRHAAKGMTPYRAVFGSDAFEFDCGLLQRLRTDKDPEELAERLREVHAELMDRDMKSRQVAARIYDCAVEEVVFAEGDRVLVWDDASAVAIGRKLRTHWLGPYVVEKRLTSVSYMLRAESDHRIARVHVNRMRRWSSQAAEDARDPKAGLWPDSRRVVQSILDRREREGKLEYRIPKVGRRGSAWVSEASLPEVVVRAYELLAKERAQLSESRSHVNGWAVFSSGLRQWCIA
jgi:Integrase core domain